MKKTLTICFTILISFLLHCPVAKAENPNQFKNADFATDLSDWYVEGGTPVYLTLENKEGKKGDPNVTPAIKMELSPFKSGLLMQDLTDKTPRSVSLSIDVLISKDFVRKPSKDTELGWEIGTEMPVHSAGPFDADFWIQSGVQALKLFKIEPNHWNTLVANFALNQYGYTHFEFHVPTGSGVIYLKNPSASYK